jgi:hypothetical protein
MENPWSKLNWGGGGVKGSVEVNWYLTTNRSLIGLEKRKKISQGIAL